VQTKYLPCAIFAVEPSELYSHSVHQTFNEKVQNGYIHNIENLHTEAIATIGLIRQQNEMLQQTLALLTHQVNALAEIIKNK
jgi:hypothetical protein